MTSTSAADSVAGAAARATSDLLLLPPATLERLGRLVAALLRLPTSVVVGPPREGGDGARVLLLAATAAPPEPVLVEDTATSDATLPIRLPSSARAVAAFPVGVPPGAPAAAMYVLMPESHRWSPTETAILRDLASSVGIELDLRHNVLHDALTGLPSRGLFLDRVAHAVERARRHKDFHFAVLALDLDRFGLVNESLGRQAGDEVLAAVAQRLVGCVRGEDMVARLDGDEFAILIESISDESDGGRVAERIHRALAEPITVGHQEVYASGSIGVVLGSGDVAAPAPLLQNAMIAAGRAQKRGRGRYEMFDRAMHERALGRLRAETDLRHAIDRKEFELYYQPLVVLDTGIIAEVEALVRWRHPDRGIVAPLEFIPLAEETGLIVPIGSWVLMEACRQVHAWQRQFPRDVPLAVSVNMSTKQLTRPDFVDHVSMTLALTGLAPASLRLEITESCLIEEPEQVRPILHGLKQLGIQIYLDDFGTGYSSLRYLHELPLDAIKIDRSFVMRMHEGETHRQLVNTVRELARHIGVAAVAEGVETKAQLEALRQLGCESAQGYLFSKPVPTEMMERLIAADPRW